MDQLKQFLPLAKKYGFWIGSALVFLGSLGVWFMTTSKLSTELASQTAKIEGDFGSVTTVRSSLPEHPNPTSHAAMEIKIDKRLDEVLRAWQSVYDRQRHILTWPVGKIRQELIDELADKIPIEKYYVFPVLPEDELESSLLNNYRYYIGNALPDIAKIAHAEWTANFDPALGAGASGGMGDTGMGGGMGDTGMGGGMGPTMGAEDGPLVRWSDASQNSLLSDLFPWRSTRPTTLDVYYSQENLWILTQMLQVIRNVNGEARQRFQAKIREITQLSIGKSVRFGAGSIATPGGGGGGMDMGMGMGGMDMGMGGMDMGLGGGMDMGMGGMDMGMGMGGGMGGVAVDPADSRYVDAQYQPITGAALRSALDSKSPSDASLAVAKRVPVKMQLKMDQRAIPTLIAECGNVPLMIEVKQVRVLPKTAAGGGGMDTGMGDTGSGMGGGMGGMGGEMGGMDGMGGGFGGATASAQPAEEFPFDMTVELYGLISIYNPPNKANLGVEQVTADTVVDGESMREGGAEVVTPPAAPATPPVEDALPAPVATEPAAVDPTAAPNPGAQPNPGVPPNPAAGAVPAPPTAITSPLPGN